MQNTENRDIKNLFWNDSGLTALDREALNGHQSCVVWFTGLSGSGKTTLANELERMLHYRKYRAFVLDGDNVRHGLCSDLGFSYEDRKENIRRVGEVSKLIMDSGVIAITAFISPFRNDRNTVRHLIQKNFYEIYCRASLEACEIRDVKGLYKKARSGNISDFTGIDSPYEEPSNPELILDTEYSSIEDCVDKIIDMLKSNGVL